ncbi:TPA: hypothetical protein DCZ09_02410 [Candidatus Nomurabacteria bacterium]|nr:hypothetical protein [Candidatus Nomurabacteria bacterium]
MLTDCLIEIDRGLLQDLSKTLPPLWVLHEKYSSKKEVNIQKNINSNVEKIKKIENDNKKLQSELLEEQGLKDLLYEQGKPLENAVIKALEILGFKAENYDDGELELDQIITSPEGYRYIGECEGKNEKDIDITKFRQLLESLNADFDREGVEEKAFGILFGNAQRLTEPQSRILDFTQKCKTGANREKIALVKTADLFNVAQFLKENKNDKFQKECRTAIYNGLGRIVVFPSVPTDSQNIFTNPGDGWEEKKLGDIGKVLMCKRVFKDQTTTAGDIPFYKIGTFGKEPDAYISKEIYDKFRKKFSFPKKGDILISASGTIGRRVKYDGEPAYFQDSNIVWIDNDENKVLNDYLYHFYGACKWSSTKGATISRLYNDNLKQIKIVFPKSLTEQRAIVAKFDALSAETKKLEAVYHQKITDLEELKKSVLHKAFNGELVRVGA